MNVQTVVDPTSDLIEQARRVLPGGSFGNMPAEVVLKEGKGGRIWDEAGREYVDFLLGSGPMFVGHAHPEVTAAVQAQVPLGTTFFANNRHGIALAEAICDGRALRRPGALRLLRHRGRSLRHAGGPRLPQARQDPEVRGRLSRHERLRADVAGAQAARQLPAPDARLGRHSQVSAGRDAGRGLQRHRHGRKPDRGAEGRAGRRDRRAVPAPDPAQARLPAGAAGGHAQSTAFR